MFLVLDCNYFPHVYETSQTFLMAYV